MLPLAIEMPLPPSQLSKNSRVSERSRRAWFRRSKEDARKVIWAALKGERPMLTETIAMDVLWRDVNRSFFPDDDNAIARCAAIRDGAEAAGLVADDATIRVGVVTCERGDPGVVVTFRRIDDTALHRIASLAGNYRAAKDENAMRWALETIEGIAKGAM